MKALYKIDERGFSLTELMFAMAILAVGLLALASMQMMAIRGTVISRDFNIASNLARDGIEQMKPSRNFIILGTNVSQEDIMSDVTHTNDDDDKHDPDIDASTSLTSIPHDRVELLLYNEGTGRYDTVCGPRESPNNCNAEISSVDWDFMRIYNVKNLPDGFSDGNAIMKDINVIVAWQEDNQTRSVNVRTVVARKDDDFF